MRKEKEYLLDHIREKIDEAKSFIITKYGKVTANAMADFRNVMSVSGSKYEVMAKRLLVKAAGAQGIELKKETLEGHIGVVFPKADFLAAAKDLRRYVKENPETIEILGGFFEGELYDGASVIRLSELPSKEEMRASFLATLEAPMGQTLAVFEALLTSVIHCVDNKAKQ